MSRCKVLVATGLFALSAPTAWAGPLGINSPGAGFSSTDGQLALDTTWNGRGLSGHLTITVQDCGVFVYDSAADGSLIFTGGSAAWLVDADLGSCLCTVGAIEVTHHCDGYGSVFETCELLESDCTDRAITIALESVNNGGTVTGSTNIAGTLLAGEGGLIDVYVPQPFWTEEDDGSLTCWSRENSASGRSDTPPNQGGSSCEDLGLFF